MNENKQIRQLVIPEQFFKAAAGNKLYARIWFHWLSEFVDEIFEPEFLEKQSKAYAKWLKSSEIKEVYDLGVQLLQQNDFKILETSGNTKRASKPLTKEEKRVSIIAIEYLNSMAGTTFSSKGSNLELVASRLREGYSIAEIKLVIDKKVKDWKGSDYSKYLRPITLFAKTKFENYLNGTNQTNPTGKLSKLADSINKAQQLIEFYKKP